MKNHGEMEGPAGSKIVPAGRIRSSILLIRGKKVIIDADLAEMYGVPTKRLNEQVKRNRNRFPDDFMFQITAKEKADVVANCDHLCNLKYSSMLPNAFTEYGAIMAASVLNTARAIDISVLVVRAFVRLREFIGIQSELICKVEELDEKVDAHDGAIQALMDAIDQLMAQPEEPEKEPIGFNIKKTGTLLE